MITNKDIKYLDYSKKISKLSEYHGVSIGAIAVYKKVIISTGFNMDKTHPKQKEYNIWRFKEDGIHKLHAEVNCLMNIKYLDINWNKVKIYIFREHKNGKLALARPCASCYNLIKDMGITQIYYTIENGYSCEIII